MRVKSRKPPAAKSRSSAALPREAISYTSAKESRCGRWLTAAKIRSCSSAPAVLTRAPIAFPGAPHECQRLRRRLRHRGQHDARAAEQVGARRVHAARLAPGDGMPRHESREALAKLFARDANHFALGAARVGDHRIRVQGERHVVQHRGRSRAPARRPSRGPRRATASETDSAARSMTPSSAARWSAGRVAVAARRRCAARPARRSASANEPPIRPTPMTAMDLQPAHRLSPCAMAPLEGGEEARVLLGQADRDAQVLGHSVAGDRTHDHARRRAAPCRLRSASPTRTVMKLPRDGMYSRPRRSKPRVELLQAGRVHRAAFCDELMVVERSSAPRRARGGSR